jgi:hypothetical protein
VASVARALIVGSAAPPDAVAEIVPVADLANWAVLHLTQSADLTRATGVGQTLVADCEQVMGADHPGRLTSRNNLAGAYVAAGQLGPAIPLYEATLVDRVRVLGADHPDTLTLTSRNHLADAYRSAEQLDKEMPLFEATLADRQREPGAEHPTRPGRTGDCCCGPDARHEHRSAHRDHALLRRAVNRDGPDPYAALAGCIIRPIFLSSAPR